MKTINGKSEYEIQSEAFLQEHCIAFSARFLFHGPHWEGDKDNRNVWELSLTRRGKQTLSVKFGQSIADSFMYPSETGSLLVAYNSTKRDKRAKSIQTKRNVPTPYDLLACLTKYDPGTFEDFCGEFGYDTDSRKAEKTYFAVQGEWKKVHSFFSSNEIEKLSEIN